MYKFYLLSIDRQWLIEIVTISKKCLIIFTHKLDQNKKWYCNVSNHHIFGVSEYPRHKNIRLISLTKELPRPTETYSGHKGGRIIKFVNGGMIRPLNPNCDSRCNECNSSRIAASEKVEELQIRSSVKTDCKDFTWDFV